MSLSGLERLLLVLLFLFGATPGTATEPVEIIIQGVEGEALDNVRAALALPPGIVQDGVVNRPWLERVVAQAPDKAREALKPFGYYHAQASAGLEQVTEGAFRLAVTVVPGEPVRVAGVEAAVRGPGAGEKLLMDLMNAFPLKQGDVLLQRKYEEAKGAIRSRAVGLGYLDAEFTVHRIEIDPAQGIARISLELKTGPQYRFGELRFEGTRRYSESFLRRYAAFKPGDVFSYARLGETQLNLVNSERFTEVIPTPEKHEAVDHRVPVVLRLQEAPTRRLRPGIGYATDIGPRLSVEYRDLNAFEGGNEFHSELSLASLQQRLGAGYILPDAKDMNSFTGLQASLKREDAAAYVTRVASIEGNRTRGMGRGGLGTLYLRLEQEHSTVAGEAVRSRLVLPGIRLSERRYDSRGRPEKGQGAGIDVRGTHEALGSNSRFLQVVTEADLLTPLPQRFSLLARVKAGATFLGEPFNELPVSYRFFAGGDRSVRGYAYQSLGPKDAAGSVVGGRNLLAGSIELERALFTKWGAAVFYDAGNALNSFSSPHLFESAGIGARYYAVLGAFRLDLARQLAVPRPAYRLHFTVGFAF